MKLKWPPGFRCYDDFRTDAGDDHDLRLRRLKATVWFLRENRRVLEKTGMDVDAQLKKMEEMTGKFGGALNRLEKAQERCLQEEADAADARRANALKVVEHVNLLDSLSPEEWERAYPPEEREKLQATLPELRAARARALKQLPRGL